jgi:hypothetical protein
MGERPLNTSCVNSFGFGERRKATFHWESVGIQPIEKSGFPKDSSIWILRGMNMGI